MQVTEAIDRFKHEPIEKVSDLSIQNSHVRLVLRGDIAEKWI